MASKSKLINKSNRNQQCFHSGIGGKSGDWRDWISNESKKQQLIICKNNKK
jgi:hypothetical protein